ncbi:MAG TPA: response regulator transcription factor [Chloroflexaceae bacterium]|nr:response regulator transcription factor [Chloroflexaceae bacterium]
MDAPRLLLVEDEPVMRMVLDVRLRAAGLRVTGVASAEQALELLRGEQYAIMVTDLHLQGLDGLALLCEARRLDPDLEVLVLTGAATLDSAIAALHNGAHSYLRKPAPKGELEGRVAAALERRRARTEGRAVLMQLGAQILRIAEPGPPRPDASPAVARLRVGRLELDPQQRRATADRLPVALSSSEFDLLLYLARREDQVLSAEQLARDALGCCGCAPCEARELVKVRVHRLRQKIERDPRAPRLLVSVRGAGYMLTATDERSPPA